jgi:hypothetical protein
MREFFIDKDFTLLVLDVLLSFHIFYENHTVTGKGLLFVILFHPSYEDFSCFD